MANTLMSLLVEIGIDSSKFQEGVKESVKSVETFGGKMENVGKSITKVGVGLTAGLTLPIVAFGASAMQSAMESESAMAELEAVIKSTGGAAGVTAQQATDLANAFQKTTKFSDEAVINGESMLLTFTGIGKDVFPQATEAMLNMAEKFGGVDQAAIQLGKALNDPITGVGALRRVGVSLSDAQEQQIKDFMAVNDIASAQKIILGELETEFGGLAKAAGETTAGKFEQFKNQLDNVKETIGTAIIPVLMRFMEAITPLIEKFANASPQMQNLIMIFAGVAAAIGPVISVVGGLVTGIGAIAPVVAAIGAALAPIALPILAIIAAIALLYLAWKTNFLGIQETLKTAFQAIQLVFAAFKAALSGDWRGFGELLRQAWDLVWGLIEKRVQGAWNAIVTAAKNIVEGVRAAFTIDWSQLGTKIIQGIINGLKAGIQWVKDTALSVAHAAVEAMKGFLGIQSPSKVMYSLGENTALGFYNGMISNKDLLDIPGALNLSPTVARVGPSTSQTNANTTGGNNITINIENPKKETAEESIRRTLKSLSYTGVVS